MSKKRLFLVALILSCNLGIYAQGISLRLRNVTVAKAMTELRKKTGYSFVYEGSDLNTRQRVNVDAKDLRQAADQILGSQNVTYTIQGKNIVVSAKSKQSQGQARPQNTVKKEAGHRTVKGHVTDENGEPIIGATIMEKGTQNGTISDINGNYTLEVGNDAQLIVSYVGFEPQTLSAQAASSITLHEDAESLNEVVVVGYGTQRKVNLTGSVTAIDTRELSARKVSQTSMALQGVAPGVTVTQTSGQPGADAGSVRIRGIGTLNDSNPLVLIDGVEGDLNSVDAGSIESISVLKDAASASIYGSKAANGVILVTTKRAQTGKFSISYNGYLSKQSATDLPQKVGAIDHMMLLNEAKINAGAGAVYTDDQIRDWATKGSSNRDLYPDTDWQKEVLKGSGIQQSHTVTLQGGNERLRAYASMNYLNQKGIIKNIGYERFSLRLNTDFNFSKQFSVSMDIFANYSKNKSVAPYNSNSSNGSGIGYVFYLMNKLPAVQACRYSNGLYAEGQNGENPVAFINQGGFSTVEQTPITAKFSFMWNPIKQITVRGMMSPSVSSPVTKNMINSVTTYNPDGSIFTSLPSKSELTQKSDYNKNLQSNLTATYEQAFGYHSLKVMAGTQYEYAKYSVFSAFRDNILKGFYELQSGSVDNQKSDGYSNEYALLSYFSRINYDYHNRYLLEANVRYDGSSRFSKGHKWGLFPSVSAGWRISEEPFWERLRNIVPNLKLRASYGTLGNQNLNSYYPFASNVNLTTNYISNDQLQSGAAITVMSNPNIKWETTHMTDIGVDFSILSKLNVTFDWYYKKTKDILMELQIPGTMGVDPTYQNAGVVRNIGWDLSLQYGDHIGEFKYNVAFNLSDVKNKIISLKGINGTDLVTNREGYSINSLYMLKSMGMLTDADFNPDGTYKYAPQYRNLAPGDLRYADLDNNGRVNDEDREVLGSTIPRFTYGLSLYGEYKGFDLNILLQGVGKVDGYLVDIQNPFFSGGTIFKFHKDRWTKDNPNTNAQFPRLYFGVNDNNYRPSDFYMKSAAYLRLKNLQIGYTIPQSITRKFAVQNLRVYFLAENLFTITGFWDGWDPEVAPGQGGRYYPQVKNIGFGIDLKF